MGLFDVEIMIDVDKTQVEKIISGELTSIVRRQIPDPEWIRLVGYESKKPIKLYIYNGEIGVFAQSDCVVSTRGVYYFGGVSSKEYLSNKQKYAESATQLNKLSDISGTCMTLDEYRDYVGLNRHCFFVINNVYVFDKPLDLNDFFVTNRNYGRKYPHKKLRTINGWCYAQRVIDEKVEDKQK